MRFFQHCQQQAGKTGSKQSISVMIDGESRRESRENHRGKASQGKYLRNLFTLSINNHQQPLITWQA
jgi:hypothetical protein